VCQTCQTARPGHHVNSTPLLDTPSWKSSAPSEFVDFHHIFIHLIFLSGPRHRDTGTVTAYLIIFIYLDCRRQPFLTPVPPLGTESVLTKILLPLRYILAIIRTSLVLLLALVYVISVRVVCLVLVKLYIYYFFHHLLIHIQSYPYLHCTAPLNICSHIFLGAPLCLFLAFLGFQSNKRPERKGWHEISGTRS
jgi:hypothetical protein